VNSQRLFRLHPNWIISPSNEIFTGTLSKEVDGTGLKTLLKVKKKLLKMIEISDSCK